MTEKIIKWKRALIFGAVALFLCGIGDWLIGYMPQGGESFVLGFMNTSITQVPSWFYFVSMVLGILSGFGCKYYASTMVEILENIGVNRTSKMFKNFRFGLSSAPLMFVSFHTACCVALLLVQAALKVGIDATTAEQVFLVPVAFTLIPFTIWCFIVDIPTTIAYIYFVLQGTLKLPKFAVFFSPLGMSFLTKIVYAILIAVGLEHIAFLAGCGESWGHALMCLAFLKVASKLESSNTRINNP